MINQQISRLHIIDLYLQFWGKVRRQDLTKHLDIGLVTASRILKEYAEQYPENLVYSVRERAYVWSSTFTPQQGIAAEHALEILAYGRQSVTLTGKRYGPVNVSFIPSLKASLVEAVTRAMVGRHGVCICYISGTSGASVRTVYPHAVFKSGGIWYFRAYDSKNDGFRSFRFNRVDSTPSDELHPLTQGAYSEHDHSWNQNVILSLGPHSKHPKPDALRLDLGLVERPVSNLIANEVTAPFILIDLRVDCSIGAEMNPYEYPLQLMNRAELCEIEGMAIAPGFKTS